MKESRRKIEVRPHFGRTGKTKLHLPKPRFSGSAECNITSDEINGFQLSLKFVLIAFHLTATHEEKKDNGISVLAFHASKVLQTTVDWGGLD